MGRSYVSEGAEQALALYGDKAVERLKAQLAAMEKTLRPEETVRMATLKAVIVRLGGSLDE